MKYSLPEKWDYDTDVAVIGCGAAGPTVAIAAHSARAKVLILEREPEPKGNVSISAGVIYAAGTPVQKALGIEDSAERMYNFYMAGCPGADAEKMRIIADNSANVIEWLKGLGVKFPEVEGVPGISYAGFEVIPEIAAVVPPKPGAHGAEGAGKVLHNMLLREVRNRGIEIVTETRGRELIANPEGEIIGIKAESKGKAIYIKASKGVVICTGNWEDNKDMIRLYLPDLIDLSSFSVPGEDGDGIIMAQAKGAALSHVTSHIKTTGLQYDKPGRKAIYVARFHSCIVVNKDGKRFHDEHVGYTPLGNAILEQKDKMCFVIFDEHCKETYGPDHILMPPMSPDLSEEIKRGLIKTASSINELAQKIGVDPGTLEKTVATYNKNAKLGKDPEFGSSKWLEPISKPPFYALKSVTVFYLLGGLKTNTKAQVIDVFGRVIPRLYAVGSVGSPFTVYPGGGGELANIFVFGRIAGTNVAAEASRS